MESTLHKTLYFPSLNTIEIMRHLVALRNLKLGVRCFFEDFD